MAAAVIGMAAATVIEKLECNSPLFVALWAIAAVCGLGYLCLTKTWRKAATFALHLSFVIILCGAFVTWIWGEKGSIRLSKGKAESSFTRNDGSEAALPFSLELEEFNVSFYAGSSAASDYTSRIVCKDGSRRTEASISMNHIFRHKGYRFYQAGFDEDGSASVLSVNHDPWGIGISYTGYAMLLLSILAFFFQKESRFREALRRLSTYSAAFLALLVLPAVAEAKAPADIPPAIPEETAEKFGSLYVYYNDRIAPLETMARDYCLKAYGKAHWQDYSAVQVVSGWLFYYDWWNVVPFKLKAKDRGTAKESEKEQIRMSAATGEAFKIFPLVLPDSRVEWFSCEDPLPEDLDYDRWVFIRRSLDLIHDEIKDGNWAEVSRILDKIKQYQEKTAAEVIPPAGKIRAEKLYNRISRPMVPFMASITLGLILFVFCGISMARKKRIPAPLMHCAAAFTVLLWLYLTLVLCLRWYVSGHAPFAGSYSVMMLMAWLASLAAVLLYRKISLLLPMGLIVAGFTMLVASLASANPQITHLMPVLQSPLLSIHVLCMMISYTLLGLVALTGIMGLLMPLEASERLMDISRAALYPAVFLLCIGTFLGAVWANISWGSYWSWDPKETWALITMLIYAAPMHGSSLGKFSKPRFYHAWCALAFVTVLITYFGVNFFLGGMHAYA